MGIGVKRRGRFVTARSADSEIEGRCSLVFCVGEERLRRRVSKGDENMTITKGMQEDGRIQVDGCPSEKEMLRLMPGKGGKEPASERSA